MGWLDLLRRDPKHLGYRELRRAYDTIEGTGTGMLVGARIAHGELWPVMPARYRTAAERRSLDRLDEGDRALIEAAMDAFLSQSSVPALIGLKDRPTPFLTIAGYPFVGLVEVYIDREVRHAPIGFVEYLAAYAVAATPSHLHSSQPDGGSSWPSRSAMAGIRRHLAVTGDYPAPSGWTYAASTQLRRAYNVIGGDRRTRYASGHRLTSEMAAWADAQPDPYDPRHYPSWRSRYVIQEADGEIWAGTP